VNHLTLRLKTHGQEEQTDYLVVEVSIDGNVLTNFDTYATNLPELIRSSTRAGTYFILTCWCGNAECAGIRQGIQVRHDHGNVFWQIVEPAPKQRFVFALTGYQQAIQDCIKQGKRSITYRLTVNEKPFEITPSQNESLFLNG
jgi:hypothetical protein